MLSLPLKHTPLTADFCYLFLLGFCDNPCERPMTYTL